MMNSRPLPRLVFAPGLKTSYPDSIQETIRLVDASISNEFVCLGAGAKKNRILVSLIEIGIASLLNRATKDRALLDLFTAPRTVLGQVQSAFAEKLPKLSDDAIKGCREVIRKDLSEGLGTTITSWTQPSAVYAPDEVRFPEQLAIIVPGYAHRLVRNIALPGIIGTRDLVLYLVEAGRRFLDTAANAVIFTDDDDATISTDSILCVVEEEALKSGGDPLLTFSIQKHCKGDADEKILRSPEVSRRLEMVQQLMREVDELLRAHGKSAVLPAEDDGLSRTKQVTIFMPEAVSNRLKNACIGETNATILALVNEGLRLHSEDAFTKSGVSLNVPPAVNEVMRSVRMPSSMKDRLMNLAKHSHLGSTKSAINTLVMATLDYAERTKAETGQPVVLPAVKLSVGATG